ncbi:MAG: hypothetical protein ABR928_22350 [Terracidiphilus sp.]
MKFKLFAVFVLALSSLSALALTGDCCKPGAKCCPGSCCGATCCQSGANCCPGDCCGKK